MGQGIPVVASTKINNGAVVPSDPSTASNGTYIASAFLNPVKSRRLLQVRFLSLSLSRAEALLGSRADVPRWLQILLALGKNATEIRDAFEEPLRTYLY